MTQATKHCMLPPTHFPVHPLNHEVQFSFMLNFNRRNHAEPSFCRGRHLSCKIIYILFFSFSGKQKIYVYIYRGLTLSGPFKTEPPAVECAVVACSMQMIMISGGFHVCMLLIPTFFGVECKTEWTMSTVPCLSITPETKQTCRLADLFSWPIANWFPRSVSWQCLPISKSAGFDHRPT